MWVSPCIKLVYWMRWGWIEDAQVSATDHVRYFHKIMRRPDIKQPWNTSIDLVFSRRRRRRQEEARCGGTFFEISDAANSSLGRGYEPPKKYKDLEEVISLDLANASACSIGKSHTLANVNHHLHHGTSIYHIPRDCVKRVVGLVIAASGPEDSSNGPEEWEFEMQLQKMNFLLKFILTYTLGPSRHQKREIRTTRMQLAQANLWASAQLPYHTIPCLRNASEVLKEEYKALMP